MTCKGWAQHLEFWGIPTHQEGTIRIAVGVADGPHRVLLNHPEGSQRAWNGRGLGSAFEAAKTEVIEAAGDNTFNSAAEATNALEIKDQAKEDKNASPPRARSTLRVTRCVPPPWTQIH